MDTDDWLPALFHAIDAKDTEAFVGFLAPDVSFRFGNAAPVAGREAVGDAVSQFFASIRALRHRLLDRWQRDDSLVCRGEVTYTRHDGSEVSVPFANVFRLHDGRIGEYLIYVDITPLFAP